MNKSKSQEAKNLISSRRLLITLSLLAIIDLVRIIFISKGPMYSFMHWVTFIILTICVIGTWYDLQKKKKQLQNSPT